MVKTINKYNKFSKRNQEMVDVKGIAIITNHFKEQPVVPKIVYANKILLGVLGYALEELTEQEPSKIFHNWNKDQFIEEIVNSVEQKVSWGGILDTMKKSGEIIPLKFIITPVYNINNEINYYSCSAEIDSAIVPTYCENDGCLDSYVESMSQFYAHFMEVCQKSPANLLKIDSSGKINFINDHAASHFGLQLGMNLFEMIDSKTRKHFINKNVIGKVSKLNFEFFNNQNWQVQCKFWPLYNSEGIVTGYSLSLIDDTKRKDIAKQFLALKGA